MSVSHPPGFCKRSIDAGKLCKVREKWDMMCKTGMENVYHVHELAFVSLTTSNKSLYKLRFLSQ